MRKIRLNLSLAFAGFVGLLACAGPYDPAGLSTTLAEAQCQFAFDCCSAAERYSFGFTSVGTASYSNKDECLDEMSRNLRASFNIIVEAQTEGRIEWDAAAAEECYKASKTAAEECNAEDFYGISCDVNDYIIGKVAAGGSCYNAFECAEDGAVCETKSSDDDEVALVTLVGECVGPLQAGEDCGDSVGMLCAPGLYCNSTDETCVGLLPVYSDCSEGVCDFETGYCDFANNTLCTSFKEDGAQCNGSFECRSGDCDFVSGSCVAGEAVNGVDLVYEKCTGEVI